MRYTAAETAGRWPSILSALVPEIQDAIKTGRHIPCPVHGGKDGFRLFTDGSGGGVCNTCGVFGDGIKILGWLRGWDFLTAVKEIRDVLPGTIEFKPAPRPDPTIRLRKIQSAWGNPGDAVRDYLAGRGIKMWDWKRIKQHDALTYYLDCRYAGQYQAMVGIVTDVDDKPVTLHVTYLNNGKKADVIAPKKILPSDQKVTGCAVRLGSGEHIAVTEGIETAMAVWNKTGLATWAALSDNGMRRLRLPDYVKAVSIYADNDASYAGQAAGYDLAKRLVTDGIKVSVHIPPVVGTDWAD